MTTATRRVLSSTAIPSQSCSHTVFEGGVETILPSFVDVGREGEEVEVRFDTDDAFAYTDRPTAAEEEGSAFRGSFQPYEVGDEFVYASCDGFLIQFPRRECQGFKEESKVGVTIRRRS